MSKKVTIPTDGGNPFVVIHNGIEYIFHPGEIVNVPDGVALEIEEYKRWREKYWCVDDDLIGHVVKMVNGVKPDKDGNVNFDGLIKGADGYSPTVIVTKVGKATAIAITDKNGTKVATINDGDKGEQGEKGDRGDTGVYVGSDTPPETSNVWVNPEGEPTGTEGWEFDLADGTTETKQVVVIDPDESNQTGKLGILKFKQADGTWAEIPAIVGKKGDKGDKGDNIDIERIAVSYDDGGQNEVVFTNGMTLYVKNGSRGATGERGLTGLQGPQGPMGNPGVSGVYIGSDTPPATANVWINPEGEPTSVEDWEFELDDGTTKEKTVVVLDSDDASDGEKAAILRFKQADGSWLDIPALVGPQGPKGEDGAMTFEELTEEQKASLKGEDGVSVLILRVEESNMDGGENVVTFTDGSKLTIKNGRPGADGEDGRSVTIGSIAESLEDGGENYIYFSDGTILAVKNGKTGAKGDKGDKGDTGAPGDNYVLTDTDKSEIAAAVKAGGLTTADIAGAADTNYTVLKARAESLNSADTTPNLNGAIAWTYE